jgi:hypothetical protein
MELNPFRIFGATRRSRTGDPLITNQQVSCRQSLSRIILPYSTLRYLDCIQPIAGLSALDMSNQS